MGAVNLPQFDRLVSGDDYVRPAAPTNDAVDLNGLTSSEVQFKSVGLAPAGDYDLPSPCDIISLATKTQGTSPNGAFLPSNLHAENWLDPMTPHISPEPNPSI